MYKPLIRQKLLFFFLDFFCILLAFVGAFYVRLGGFYRPDFPFGDYFENALLISPLWLVFLAWGGRYSLSERKVSDIFRVVSLSGLAGTMLFVLIFFFRREIFFSRLIVMYIFLFGTILGMASYFLEKSFEKWKVRTGKDTISVLIIGANRASEETVHQLLKQNSRHQPVAILTPFGSSKREIAGVPILGKLDALERTVEQKNIQEIFLCDGIEQMMNLLLFAEGRFLDFRVSPEILGVFRENIAPEIIAQKPFLTLQTSPLFGWGQFWKRLFDVCIAFISLILLAPIWLFQKMWRMFSQRSPFLLFEKEDRIGAKGRQFKMFRYTGRKKDSVLRDIPNVINVLKGEMSLVGPRPALPKNWKELPAHYKRRMVLRPGMLGLWQLKKLQGERDNFEKMCKDDLNYIHHWSFVGDIRIVLQSICGFMKGMLSQKSKVESRK